MINLFQYMIQIECFFTHRISHMIAAKFSITVHHQMGLEIKTLYILIQIVKSINKNVKQLIYFE